MPRSAETTYRIMSAIKSKRTKPEQTLSHAMWKIGLRYRRFYKISGKPDFAFVRTKIAVFCDGDFWHGNNWRIRGLRSLESELSKYSDFWVSKICRNVERDKLVNQRLTKEGWLVIRLWESEIEKKPDECANIIKQAYLARVNGSS